MIATLRALKRRLQAGWEAGRAFAAGAASPLFVYQMGKVGSSTVYHAVRAALPGVPVYHVHFLSAQLAEHRATHERSGMRPVPYHIYLGEALRGQLLRHAGRAVRIISLVRDPIAFELSNLFQNPRLVAGGANPAGVPADRDGLRRTLERRLAAGGGHGYVDGWFDREMKTVFGIDVYAEPFDSAAGWQHYRHGRAELLLIRLEDLDRQGPAAIADFLELSGPLALATANDRSRQANGGTYAELGRAPGLDPAVVEGVYAGRYARHFYAPAERQAFAARWIAS